ncbi:MAG: zinc-dependent peptidase [Gemmataceae bacterium]
MKTSLSLAVLAILLGTAEAKDPPAKPTAHTERNVEGWTVHIDDRLLATTNKLLGQRAVRLLKNQLFAITLVLPADKVKQLQRTPIWLDLTHGELERAQYHPSADWLTEHGYAKDLAKSVHIPDARAFAEARFQRAQPWCVLHELAHAFHDQILGFDNAEIRAAWERFVKSGRYKEVLHISGRQMAHYGLTNEREFFAEMTETYFGQNDFFPFNSAELQHEEPEIYKLLSKIWGPLP